MKRGLRTKASSLFDEIARSFPGGRSSVRVSVDPGRVEKRRTGPPSQAAL